MTIQRVKLSWLVVNWIVINLFLSSCAVGIQPSVLPPSEFTEDDLIGVWQTDGRINDKEIIVISADQQFYQIFESSSTDYYAESEGFWEIKTANNGCTYLYLHGMKYFYQSRDVANNGNRWTEGISQGFPRKYWDECSETDIEMPDMVILFVSQFPDYPKNLILRHMAITRDREDIVFYLLNAIE